MLGLLLLLGSQIISQAAGLIIIHDPEMPEPPIIRPPWPDRPPHHPPHWMPRPIHRFTALEVKSLEADVKISGQVAETKIEQVFYNPNPRQLEGTFMLPLPKGAHLKNFRMEVNGKMMDAELLAAVGEIAAAEGLFVAPEGGACLPALKRMIENREVDKGERVVIFNTGSGLKYLECFGGAER